MRNTYIMLALLPLLFQGAVYGADLNKVLQQQLISARRAMNRNVKLELDPVLQALVSFSQEGKAQKAVAILRIKAIKMALEKYRSQQDLSWVSWLRGATPQIVKNQIDPALAKVENALKLLNATSMNTGYIVGGTVLGVAAATAITTAIWYFTNGSVSAKAARAGDAQAVLAAQNYARAARLAQRTLSFEYSEEDALFSRYVENAQITADLASREANKAQDEDTVATTFKISAKVRNIAAQAIRYAAQAANYVAENISNNKKNFYSAAEAAYAIASKYTAEENKYYNAADAADAADAAVARKANARQAAHDDDFIINTIYE